MRICCNKSYHPLRPSHVPGAVLRALWVVNQGGPTPALGHGCDFLHFTDEEMRASGVERLAQDHTNSRRGRNVDTSPQRCPPIVQAALSTALLTFPPPDTGDAPWSSGTPSRGLCVISWETRTTEPCPLEPYVAGVGCMDWIRLDLRP